MKNLNKYKEEIQNTRVQPSENSWEKLNEKLNGYDAQQKNKKWLFLKYAAIILIAISVGFYFFKPKPEIINTKIIVAPTSKEIINKTPVINSEPETLITEKPIKNQPKTQNKIQKVTVKKSIIETKVAFENTSANKEPKLIKNSMISEEIEVVKNTNNTRVASVILDIEVEELLKNSMLKTTLNKQKFKEQKISSNNLLSEVEDDLDKDFKQKLIETIVTTLKKPREILLTDRGN